MGVRDVPEPLERLEVAINGRRIDLRMAGADRSRNVFRGRVMTGPAKDVEDEPPLHGHAHALGAHVIGDAHSRQRDAIAIVLQEPTIANTCDNLSPWTSASSCSCSGWPRSGSGTASTGTTSPLSPTSRAPPARATPRRTSRPALRCPRTATTVTS